jgi:tRNA A37 threonylcarbamoyladenosine modification protein TsaB
VALRRDTGREPGFIAPFLDARRGQIFGSLYRRVAEDSATFDSAGTNTPQLKSLGEESVFSAEEFVALVKGTMHLGRPALVSPTPDVLPASLITQAFPGVCVKSVSAILAPVIGRLAFEQARRGELVDALRLDANYVRRSDAEAAWKDTS